MRVARITKSGESHAGRAAAKLATMWPLAVALCLLLELPSPSTSLAASSASDAVRGSRYQLADSTILTPCRAASAVGVRPTLEASKQTWQRAWRLHRALLPLLHCWDACRMKDSKLALACLWWKAISGNDASSPVYDHRLAYDLLPPVTRWIVHPTLCAWYPRLHHANVEIRTAYLDKAVSKIIAEICHDYRAENKTTNAISTTITTTQQGSCPIKIRFIVMGGGYDTRSLKLMEHYLMHHDQVPPSPMLERKTTRMQKRWKTWFQRRKRTSFDAVTKSTSSPLHFLPPSNHYSLECYELDLPEVVQSKRKLIQSRLSRRRPWLMDGNTTPSTSNYPTLVEVDLNNLTETRMALENILSPNNKDGISEHGATVKVANIILFEGVMIYLDQGIPHSLLQLCSDVLRNNSNATEDNPSGGTTSYLCFADRLENIPGGDEEKARSEMQNTGWELVDWLSKPGLARHMGVASCRSATSCISVLASDG
eukprot:CCRYP_000607-RB/>CCRYP_000607-RB protein AED:0.05 eAED:0.05 QI:84/1/1/1/1/1/4/494/482